MFCIAAFIVLGVLGIFSARYRRLASDAWKCVGRRVTFRKCDTNFKEDTKARLLGRVVLKHPRLAKFLDKWLDVLSFVFVLLMIWSIVVTIHAGLNLFVYDTCNPNNSESCSLGNQACSIPTNSLNFWDSLKGGHALSWTNRQASDFGTTISRIPNRIKKWEPLQYTDKYSPYYYSFDSSKPAALEIIDPGCHFCAQLFRNLKQANIESNYNLTFLPYPIPDSANKNGYKFAHSKMVAEYLDAMELNQTHPTAKVAPEWQLLERLFTWKDSKNVSYQLDINYYYSDTQTANLLQKWLADFGYTPDQVQAIVKESKSQAVANRIADQRQIVEKQIKTVKIPTLLLNHRRYDGVVSADKLH